MNIEQLHFGNDITAKIVKAKNVLSKIESALNYIEQNGSWHRESLVVKPYPNEHIELIELDGNGHFFPLTMKQILQFAQMHTISHVADLENKFTQL